MTSRTDQPRGISKALFACIGVMLCLPAGTARAQAVSGDVVLEPYNVILSMGSGLAPASRPGPGPVLAQLNQGGRGGTPGGGGPGASDFFLDAGADDPFHARIADEIRNSAVVCVAGCGPGRVVVVYRPGNRSPALAARTAVQGDARLLPVAAVDDTRTQPHADAAAVTRTAARTGGIECVAGCYDLPQRALASLAPNPVAQQVAIKVEPGIAQKNPERRRAAHVKRGRLTTAAIKARPAVRHGGVQARQGRRTSRRAG